MIFKTSLLLLLWLLTLRPSTGLFRYLTKGKPGIHFTTVLGHTTKCMKNLGCFDIGPPFFHPISRPFSFLPKNREYIRTKFTLYTSLNPKLPEILLADRPETIIKSNFNPDWPTKIIIHGFIDASFISTWMLRMKHDLFSVGKYNVILVDWPFGAILVAYGQATANIRVVAAEMIFLIRRLQAIKGARVESFHIIGHSLGAHAAGYVGKKIKNLGRITGLDAAGPYFQEVSPRVRLDASDAIFVDLIHTNAGKTILQGFGTDEVIGTVDFFPNGGNRNPGCKTISGKKTSRNFYELLVNTFSCDHGRSYEFFIASIKYPHCLVAVPCSSYSHFLVGKCLCSSDTPCSPMGLHADKYQTSRRNSSRIFYLSTGSHYPYCVFQYQIVIELEGLSPEIPSFEQLSLILRDSLHKEETTFLLNKDGYYREGITYTFLMKSQKQFGSIKDAILSWHQIKPRITVTWKKEKEFPSIKYFRLTPITVGQGRFCTAHLFKPRNNCDA